MRLLETHVFNGVVPEGSPHLTWLHVAAFAWMCGFVYHVGLNDMSIFRYARKRSYGWVGLFGMFLGHFFAWICAGVMGAAAAAILKVPLARLDSGAVTWAVIGWAGLFAVIVAGWTTATPNIYRAALSFATFFPRWSFRRLSFLVGAIIAVAACFPAVMRIDMVANIAALLVPSVGAICLVEHWFFPKLGLVRHWNLYRGRRLNPAAVSAWFTASLFALGGVLGNWMHPFFLPIPTFVVAGLAYPVFAALMGAGKSIPSDVRERVDAFEAQLVVTDAPPKADSPRSCKLATFFTVLAYLALAGLVLSALGCPQRFRVASVACTAAYFFFASVAALFQRKAR